MTKKSSPKPQISGPAKGKKPNTGRKTKKQTCIDMLKRPKGASLAELQKATGWQAHSVRGFLSGTIRKLEGIILATNAEDGGVRRYRIETQKAP